MTAAARPRLVVLRALGLGDLLTSVPALRGLRRRYPDHELILAAPGWLSPMVGMIEAVDRHLPVGELEPLPANLHGRIDVAANLHGRGPQTHSLLTALRPGRLVAFAHPEVPHSAEGPAWDPAEHEVERWCRLVRHVGADADPHDLDLHVPPFDEHLTRQVAGATLIHPGAKSAARRWPAERFAAVAAEAAAGRRIVVTGSAGERALAAQVADLAGDPRPVVLAGDLDLAALAAVVAAADRVVCGDTGVGHLATAVGTDSVLLFGPMAPAAWGPPAARRARHRVLWTGRTGDPLADEPFPGLLAISPDDVLSELAALDRMLPTGR